MTGNSINLFMEIVMVVFLSQIAKQEWGIVGD
jgi:hypothetical protein